MQVSIESTGCLEKCLKVEVPEESIATEIRNRLIAMTKTTHIKGFRRGKVPLSVVQKQYGTKVRQEVLSKVMQDSLYKAIEQENLRPASRPKLEYFDAEQTEGLVFTAKIEVLPEIVMAPLEKLIIEKPICRVSDDDVSEMIEVIRKQHCKTKSVERAANEGDSVVIDFNGHMHGEILEGGSGKDISLELGSKKFIQGFEEGLIGAKGGDSRLLKLKFPDAYDKQELAGKDIEFQVDIKIVNELILPELDNELFTILGVTSGGLEAFKADVRQNMERESTQVTRNKVKESIMEKLYEANKIDLPSSLVATEIERLQQQSSTALKKQGLDEKSVPMSGPTMFNKQAEKRLTLQLLFSDIVETNNIKVEPSRVRTMVEKLADGYEHPEEVVNWYYSDKERLAEVNALVLEEVVVDWIMQKAQVNETELAFDALINKRQTMIN